MSLSVTIQGPPGLIVAEAVNWTGKSAQRAPVERRDVALLVQHGPG
jgi:hypothetical protein